MRTLLVRAVTAGLWALAPWGCGASSTTNTVITVRNSTARQYDGSGGALGVGLEIRSPQVEGGAALTLDPGCETRRCGALTTIDPGNCGGDARRIGPGDSVVLHWDGRYFPRSQDVLGSCAGAPQVLTAANVVLSVCGRLTAPDVKAAALRCESTPVARDEAGNLPANVPLVVPGAALEPPARQGSAPAAGP